MPSPYLQPHWGVFLASPPQSQGPVGDPPSAWVKRHGLSKVPKVSALPNYQLDRNAVRSICQNAGYPLLFSYVCAMAWGGQGGGAGGKRHVAVAWKAQKRITSILNQLRSGSLSRQAAYNLFRINPVSGLGPSFFTKLIYFFSPQPSFYIMDQWTAKSINLLTGRPVVRIGNKAPNDFNKPGNYQAFCEEVDLIAGMLGVSGEVAEERLFSQGGRHPWPWRRYVKTQWAAAKPSIRYKAKNMHAIYPHISVTQF